ncbi:MAG: hypothetical protein KAR14_10930 [Candidatus Aminicenantes bacterium]|nr:hypothetical protein [Candidatus Aminicenantes bacterium]
MRRLLIAIIAVAFLFFVSGCKTSDTDVNNFQVLAVTGYSFADIGENGLTSINLFLSVANKGEENGTITGWKFRIMHNIVTLVEIDNNNYGNYNLELSGNLTIPVDEVSDIYINTPLPFSANAVPNDMLSFDPYTPTEVILDLQVSDSEGKTYTVTKKGSYTYEKGLFDSDKYNILGDWAFNRIVNGDAKATQKITFVGTKTSGSFVIYNLGSGKAEGSGSFTVSNSKDITLHGVDGTTYWGEFSSPDDISGTLLKGTDTGTWSGKKL